MSQEVFEADLVKAWAGLIGELAEGKASTDLDEEGQEQVASLFINVQRRVMREHETKRQEKFTQDVFAMRAERSQQ